MKTDTNKDRKGMGRRFGLASMAASLVMAGGTAVLAQTPTAEVHGKVTNPVGQVIGSGQVKFSKELGTPYKDEKFTNTVDLGTDGTYDAKGVAPGEYYIWVVQGDKQLDRMQVKIAAGDNKTVDFDMSRPEYLASMTPEQKKALEEYKAKNAAVMANNKEIGNLNATITGVRADLKSPSPNYDKDISDAKAATDARPTEPLLWVLYGDAQEDKAEHAANADRANKTSPSSDDAVTSGYSGAVDAYKKAADLMESAQKKPTPEIQASVYNQLGNAYAKSGKMPEAAAAYDKAVAAQPQNAGMFYGNEAATYFNAHQDAPALEAANKAIAADPNKPLPYYIKGQELLAQATVDKAGKVVAPPGCVEAYNKYLELSPDGPQAPAVKEALTALGQKIETHYSAARKGH